MGYPSNYLIFCAKDSKVIVTRNVSNICLSSEGYIGKCYISKLYLFCGLIKCYIIYIFLDIKLVWLNGHMKKCSSSTLIMAATIVPKRKVAWLIKLSYQSKWLLWHMKTQVMIMFMSSRLSCVTVSTLFIFPIYLSWWRLTSWN